LILKIILAEQLQLSLLEQYLDVYIAQSNTWFRERLSETVDRLRSVFGVGWFFEWPGGRHPLNSTWPWADVKPSLLVLWGVCWMFYMRNEHWQYRPQQPPSYMHRPRPPLPCQSEYFPFSDSNSPPFIHCCVFSCSVALIFRTVKFRECCRLAE
jgi:hypothetical protein